MINLISDERLQEIADGLQAAIAKEFGCTFVVKEDSALHQGIAKAFTAATGAVDDVRSLASLLSLDVPAIGLPTGDQYLSDFGTSTGTMIALPRAWYTPAKARTRLVVAPHEGGHVGQYTDGVDAGWWPRQTTHSVLYLCSIATKDAAEYVGKVEADQYATTEAVREWLGGPGGRRDRPRPPAYHHPEFAFVVDAVADRGDADGVERACDRGRLLVEHDRERTVSADDVGRHLRRVLGVVATDCEDLAGSRHGGEEAGVADVDRRCGPTEGRTPVPCRQQVHHRWRVGVREHEAGVVDVAAVVAGVDLRGVEQGGQGVVVTHAEISVRSGWQVGQVWPRRGRPLSSMSRRVPWSQDPHQSGRRGLGTEAAGGVVRSRSQATTAPGPAPAQP